MTGGWKTRPRGLNASGLVLATLSVFFIAVSLPETLRGGIVNAFSISFSIVTTLLAVQGVLVLWSKRGKGKVRLTRFLLWTAAGALLFALAVVVLVALDDGAVVMGPDAHTFWGSAELLLVLWVTFNATAWLWVAGLTGAIWTLATALRLALPRFLMDVKSVRFDPSDRWYKRIDTWVLCFPNVLDPSSLKLELQPLDGKGSRDRFFQVLPWQMAFGLLVAVYVSLNPMLLSAMRFDQAYALVSIPLGIIPLLIIPWSTLEALGVRATGTRRDFSLHEGAKRRMVLTLLALGTLVLFIKMAIIEVGAEILAYTFASYIVTLLILASMGSFLYFNYFEAELVNDIRDRLEKRGF